MKMDFQQRQKLAQRELKAHRCIPYAYHLDPHTVVTKDLALVQVIQVQGLPANTMSAEACIYAKQRRNALYRELSDPRLSLYSHTVRRPVTAENTHHFPTRFLQDLNTAWIHKLNAGGLYQTEHYLTLVWRPAWGTAAWLKSLWRGLTKAESPAQREALSDNLKMVHALAEKVAGRFAGYNIHRLRATKTESEILSVLHYLVNGEARKRRLPTMDVSRYLATNSQVFHLDHFEIRTPTQIRYGAVLGIKGLDYPNSTDQGLLDPVLSLHREYVLTQSFQYSPKNAAMDDIRLKLKQMEAAEDDAVAIYDDLSESIDELASNKLRMGSYHFSLTTLADSRKDLEASVADIDKALAECNIAPVREDMNMEAAFWGQLPGNEAYRARSVNVTSKNFSGLASFHGEPLGRKKNNRWGDAITTLRTENGGEYALNFHLAPPDRIGQESQINDATDKGHVSCIGPNGCGKTLLICFCLAQLMKIQYRLIYFDKDRASEIFIRSMGGQYSVIHPEYQAGFNPLQLSDTPSNRAFLHFWLELLLTANGETLTAEHRHVVEKAVDGNYKLDFEHRRLKNIIDYIVDPELVQRLAFWCEGRAKGYLFDNPFDTFEWSEGVMGLDLSHVLEDKLIQKPVIAYLFHRLSQSLDGRPTVVPFDEGWAFLQQEDFTAHMQDQLKTIRKKEGLVIFMSQDPAESANSSIRSTLNQEIATQIYFGNPKAQAEHYCDYFQLTQKQFEIVRGLDVTERKVLLIQGKDSVVLDINMSGLERFFPVLSGRVANIQLMETLRRQQGEEPEQWLTDFIDTATA